MFSYLPGILHPRIIAIVVFLFLNQLSIAETMFTERKAVERALREHQKLAAVSESVAAFEAMELQAGLRPNPELSFEIEEIRLSDGPDAETVTTDGGDTIIGRSVEEIDNSGFDGAEITLSVSQRIELGRKRAKRIALADRATQVELWNYEITRADVIASTRSAFIHVLAGQERVALRKQLMEVAKAASETVRERIEGGKVSPLQGNQADIAFAQARISLSTAERDLEAARRLLAMQWGKNAPDFLHVEGNLSLLTSLPSLDALQDALKTVPDLARWTAEVLRREDAVHLERSLGMPDLTVSAGWRNTGLVDSNSTNFDGMGNITGYNHSGFDNSRENSFTIGFSIPLPLFDRNQGRIREAEHRVREASHERRAREASLSGHFTSLYEQLSGIANEVETLTVAIVPTAVETYEATRVGFELGKFQYLNVLDAQRTLFEVRNQHMEVLVRYHTGVVQLERLLGSDLKEFSTNQAMEALTP